MCQDGLRTRKLCQSPMPDHYSNSGIIRGASPRCFPYTITWTEESTCNAGHGIGIWSAKRHWEADPTTAGRGHFQIRKTPYFQSSKRQNIRGIYRVKKWPLIKIENLKKIFSLIRSFDVRPDPFLEAVGTFQTQKQSHVRTFNLYLVF